MENHTLLFENLKKIKDYWVTVSSDSLKPDANLIWSNQEDAFHVLQNKLVDSDDIEAFRKVQDDTIRGVLHSILVMFDGGDELADKLKIDLIDESTKQSVKENIALHEEFISFLIDAE